MTAYFNILLMILATAGVALVTVLVVFLCACLISIMSTL